MNTALVTVVISGAVSLAVAVLAYFLGKQRDSEADWRRLKLDAYKEFVSAFSSVVHRGRDERAQRRYADAANSLVLVAPSKVLIALYAFQDEISYKNPARNDLSYEKLFSNLARAMRIDSHPNNPMDTQDFVFRTLDIPPSE